MSEMIERVAEALAFDRWPDRIWPSDFSEREHEDYLGHARAAIEAMREPTGYGAGRNDESEGMMAAGLDRYFLWDNDSDPAMIVSSIYTAMIDAALAQGIVTEGGDAVAAPVSVAN